MRATATSLDRVLTTLGHREPDRVPLFLLPSLQGARELGLSIREYYSSAPNVVEGQFRLRAKYGHDCYFGFFYGAIEMEAWGGETRFFDDGPPNSGPPLATRAGQILELRPPRIEECARLRQVLDAISGLKERAAGEVPVLGVVMSPYSVPVMQLGFERYLDWQIEAPEAIEHLWRINERFCVDWANAQLQAGATAICYFDPLASPTGFPFKVVQMEGTLSEAAAYENRERICDLGYLRQAYRKSDGTMGYRCASEPVRDFVRKGGDPAATEGRKCLCNGLMSNIGFGQIRADGLADGTLLTAGNDVAHIARYLPPGQDSYTAADVMRHLLGACRASPADSPPNSVLRPLEV